MEAEIARKLFKQYFEPETILEGIVLYTKVPKENIKVSESDVADYYAYQFTIPVDDKVRLRILYNAGTKIGSVAQEYREYVSIAGHYFFDALNPPKNNLDAHDHKNKINQIYPRQFKQLFTFLYYEMRKLQLDINKTINSFAPIGEGFSIGAINLSDVVKHNESVKKEPREFGELVDKVRNFYNPKLNGNKRPPEDFNPSFVRFINSSPRTNPIQSPSNNSYSSGYNQNSGCLVFIGLFINAIFLLKVLIS
ncbi:hypothetical protein [Neobacillus drentensis]|uniref:hypothetical protein n=1 Tax=Neobacillus drentensis TaxID=220684 RepID=UPI00285837CE|nr:hypothetical protein [Neobacillus drentensis]MDR7240881.1 hypothetical protein [Neobacillus drentensis]